MSRARVLICNRVPDEGTIGSNQDHCRKCGKTALGKACKCSSRDPFFAEHRHMPAPEHYGNTDERKRHKHRTELEVSKYY